MRTATSLGMTLLLVLGLAGTLGSETVFTTEPLTPLRPRPGLRMSSFKAVEWGTRYDRIKTVGRWSRVSLTDTSDCFIWSEWLTTYDVVEEKPLADGARAVYFEVGKYLGGPVLESICDDVVERTREGHPALKKITVEGYLAGMYPKGERLCSARWVAGSPMEVDVPEMPPVTARDEEVHARVTEIYRSVERKGVPIFDCDSLWIEAGVDLDMTPAEVRFIYDRVRWSRGKTTSLDKLDAVIDE